MTASRRDLLVPGRALAAAAALSPGDVVAATLLDIPQSWTLVSSWHSLPLLAAMKRDHSHRQECESGTADPTPNGSRTHFLPKGVKGTFAVSH